MLLNVFKIFRSKLFSAANQNETDVDVFAHNAANVLMIYTQRDDICGMSMKTAEYKRLDEEFVAVLFNVSEKSYCRYFLFLNRIFISKLCSKNI